MEFRVGVSGSENQSGNFGVRKFRVRKFWVPKIRVRKFSVLFESSGLEIQGRFFV